MFNLLGDLLKKTSRTEASTNHSVSILDRVKAEINKHRIWCDEVMALITSFMDSPEYHNNILAAEFEKLIGNKVYKSCFQQIRDLDRALQGRILERKSTEENLKSAKKDLRLLKKGMDKDKWVDLIAPLNEFREQSAIEADEAEKLGNFKTLLIEYKDSIVNIPDIVLLKHAYHYAAATSNRNALGILANFCIENGLNVLNSKADKTLEEAFLFKLIEVYEAINSCATFGQKIDCPTQTLATPTTAKFKSSGIKPLIIEKKKVPEEFFEYIKLYILSLKPCAELLEAFINVEMQMIVNIRPCVALEGRFDFRILGILKKALKDSDKIVNLIKQDPDLSAYCFASETPLPPIYKQQ